MSTITVVCDGRRRPFAEADLPLSIGGEGTDLVLTGVDEDATLAYLGHEEGDLFIQPGAKAHGEPAVLVNGLLLGTSRWIADGDTVVAGSNTISFKLEEGHLTATMTSRQPAVQNPEAPPTAAAAGTEIEVTPTPFEPRWQTPPPRARFSFRPRLMAGLAVATVLAAGAWFVLTAHAIRVETLPGAEEIAIEGGLAIRIGDRYLLRPGTYTVAAEHPGYLALRQPLVVGPETPAVVLFELEPLGAALAVRSRPIDGAAVFVDGTEIGNTPLDGHQLSAGTHTVEIRATRHLPSTTELDVSPGAAPIDLEIDLEPNWAPVLVSSKPAGASVSIDGRPRGSTPASLEVESGSRVIGLRLSGFKPVNRRLQIETGQTVDLGTLVLVPVDGRLAVSSQPEGATVTIDREFRGTTPVEIAVAPDTPHEIKVSLAGHATHSTTATVGSGKQAEVRAALDALTGEVVIRSQPAQAEVLIDGKLVGTTEHRIELETRPHQIEIRLEGFVPHRTTVTPQVGITQMVRAELRLEGPAGLPKTVTSPQGVEMVLVAPGRLTMGAARREPGRRANEVLREVEITRAYYLAVREVSNQEFREFRSEHLSGAYGGNNLEIDHHPVVNVTWHDAARYCNWLSQKAGLPPVYVERGGSLFARTPMPNGYRLPTEAEWALAARSASTGEELKYSWGDALPIPPEGGNYGDLSALATLDGSLPDYRDGYPATAPVGSFHPNAIGVFNLGGNVSEWVQDFYALTPTAPGTIEKDPTGPTTGATHVIRGASWMDTAVTELRLSYRDSGDTARPDVGFRIVRNAQ